MTMTEWARNEVEIACKRENPNRKDGEFDYGCACYESALKAYECLCDDGHSGMSFDITKNILIRLMNDIPLTPITDEDFKIENARIDDLDGTKTIQCSRMSSLFKYISADGNITYNDINRVICKNDESDKGGFYSRMVSNIVNNMFPITMPYCPTLEPYKVIVNDFLFDERHGDFDTRGILYVITPDKERVEINRYFKEENGRWIEISQKEYELRRSFL